MNTYQKKISNNAKHIRRHHRVSWSSAKKISTTILNWLLSDRGCHLIIGIDLSNRSDVSGERRIPIGIL